jgi:collagenase-like PrtC family protease
LKLALGPILYAWPRETVLAFYRAVAAAPVDIVYCGETVCSHRLELDLTDWLEVADMLSAAGKEVVLSTQALLDSESELATVRAIVDNGRYAVEANDMAAVRLITGRAPFVAGASLDIYNPETLQFMGALGAVRWVAPVELSRAALAEMHAVLPAAVQTEVLVHGRLPLAHSHCCFTARRFHLQKEVCGQRCVDFPEGLLLRTAELEPFLVLNGGQTLSASVLNLIREVPDMLDLGLDVIRVSAPYAYVGGILECFRQAIESPHDIDLVARELERMAPAPACDGYWHGRPGMERVRIPAE